MAPTGMQRSRRRPRVVTGGLLEARKQQSCEAAALRVTAARLTRPAERFFRNQRESLRASRNAEPGPMHLSERLERDLLNLVRGGERARSRRSPSPSPPPRRRRSSRERHRGRSGSKRTARRSPSLLSSSSDASHAPRDRRRRSRRRRSAWSSSSDEPDRVTRAPAPRAARAPAPSSGGRAAPPPLVRASLQNAVGRDFVTPANAAVPTRGGGGVDSPSGGSFGRPETPKERRERLIVSHCVAELHRSLDKKRQRLKPTSDGVLSKVRCYLLDVAREARSQEPETEMCSVEEVEEEEDIADPELIPDPEIIPESEHIPEPEFIPEPQEIPDEEFIPKPEEIPDPEFIPEPQEIPDPEFIPEPEEMPDQDFIPEPQEIPDPEFLPSPEPMADEEPAMELFMEESSEPPVATPTSCLLPDSPTRADERRREEAEEEEERREPGTEAELWRARAVPSTSSFLVTWGDDAERAATWRPPPLPPPVVLDPVHGHGRWGDRGLLPPPLLPVRTALQGQCRSWSGEAGQRALPRPSPWSRSPEAHSTLWLDCRRPAPPPPPLLGAPPPPPLVHPSEAQPWMRTCEELLPNPEPAQWRGARRCFSPTADHPPMNFQYRFNRRHLPQHHQHNPRPMHVDDAARHKSETARHDGVVDAWRHSRRKMF